MTTICWRCQIARTLFHEAISRIDPSEPVIDLGVDTATIKKLNLTVADEAHLMHTYLSLASLYLKGEMP